jgi:hypothetical protein
LTQARWGGDFPDPNDAKPRQTTSKEIEFPRSIWGTEAGFVKKKSLGAHSERNVKKQVAYVLRFRDPKSLGAHSGDRSICVFAYLTVLLGGHFPILQYLIALLEGHFQNRWEPIVSAMSKKKWHTYCVFETPNRWEPIVVTGHFAFLHTLQYFWEVIFPFLHTLHGF